MPHLQIIEADWTWTGDHFENHIQLEVGTDGFIHRRGCLGLEPTLRLSHKALLPGFVNCHSHAFQRGLRGRGERFPAAAGSFWSWREAMYDLVSRTEAESLYRLSLQAFQEMLAAGITTVGEFHYLHHDSTCGGYSLDETVLQAARDAGIRLVLLSTYYQTGGIHTALRGAQRRFGSPSVRAYLRQLDPLGAKLDLRTQSLGMAAHSIRGADREDIVSLHQESRRRRMVFHMHVEEQPQEIEACVKAYGATPMALLNQSLEMDRLFTAVHCTHTDPGDMEMFAATGGNVCVCPITEANLGDGMADLQGMRRSGARVCVGTDSNSRICMTEELRWLEYVQRLKGEKRGCLLDASGDLGKALLEIATVNGARSLALRAGKVEPGCLADLVAIDLETSSMAGWTPSTLLATFLLGTGNGAVSEVCVGGRWSQVSPCSPG
ncbi:MAG: formimidoylglutamate deiminase [Acidobacteriota bacterium]